MAAADELSGRVDEACARAAVTTLVDISELTY
jgi:hypothetical protein